MGSMYGTGTTESYPKNGCCTQEEQSTGTKVIKQEMLSNGQAADIGTVPPSRVYTKDYCKVEVVEDDPDTVSPFLGNPLRW